MIIICYGRFDLLTYDPPYWRGARAPSLPSAVAWPATQFGMLDSPALGEPLENQSIYLQIP